MALQARLLEKLLRNDGVAVTFFSSNFPLLGWLRPFGFVPGVRTMIRFGMTWVKLWRAVRQVEIVHVLAASWLYFFLLVWPSVLVGSARRKRVVLNYRGGEAARFFRKYGWFARPVFKLATVVTAPSDFLAEVIGNHFGIPVVIVPNILDVSAFPYRERGKFQPKLLVNRHLEKIYDVESVLKALRMVQQTHPEASLWIAGSGSQEGRLRHLVSQWGLRHVCFLGHVAHGDLPAICDQCDILVNASRVDNFPGALLEASAAGLVVVSTAAGGIPFVYQDGRDAVLVPPGDWQGLGRAVQEMLVHPSLAADLAQAAAALARRCEWKEVRKHLYAVYGLPLQEETHGGEVRCIAG
jgi:glycosyltransferase involved in cell wall biosynthesis